MSFTFSLCYPYPSDSSQQTHPYQAGGVVLSQAPLRSLGPRWLSRAQVLALSLISPLRHGTPSLQVLRVTSWVAGDLARTLISGIVPSRSFGHWCRRSLHWSSRLAYRRALDRRTPGRLRHLLVGVLRMRGSSCKVSPFALHPSSLYRLGQYEWPEVEAILLAFLRFRHRYERVEQEWEMLCVRAHSSPSESCSTAQSISESRTWLASSRTLSTSTRLYSPWESRG